MMACGVVVGWTYLRFYQSRGKGMRGDMSENFSAATLFPKPLRFVNKKNYKGYCGYSYFSYHCKLIFSIDRTIKLLNCFSLPGQQ